MEHTPRAHRNQIKHRRTTWIAEVTAFITVVFVVLILIGNIFTRDKTYSESENRMLAARPTATFSDVTSGKFTQNVEEYVSDQFVLRDAWISLNVHMNLALGIRESNGVYIGKKDYLFEITDTPNQAAIDDNLAAIAAFGDTYSDINTVMTLVPNSIYILDQLLPDNAPVRDQSKDIAYAENAVASSVDFVDLVEMMSAHKKEYIYYKTDHHWTTLGAKYAFEALSEPLGIEDPETDYSVYPVTHDFSGTLASTSGYTSGRDTIDIYVPKQKDTQCVVNFVDDGTKSASLYNSNALDTKNKYEVFLGGNYARVDISTPNQTGKNLLLFKDSYANCLIPFLVPYYQNIIVLDARYSTDNVKSVIKDNSITDVLILYNVNTFLSDTTLADLLNGDD